MKFLLSKKICERLKKDRDLSLELAKYMRVSGVANTLVDWLWCSGAWGIKIPQRILGLKVDGIVGEKTITAVNNVPANFLQTLYKERQEFLERITKTNPTQKKFLRGWLNRLDDLKKWNARI